MKKILIILLIIFCVRMSAIGQNANPFLNLYMNPAVVGPNATTSLEVQIGNFGNNTIVPNSIRLVISAPLNVRLTNILDGSDNRWSIQSLGAGFGNNLILTNKGATPFGAFDIGILRIGVLSGTVISSVPLIVGGNISYIIGPNPLLGGSQNASQGNTSIIDDNSTTSVKVIATKSVPVVSVLSDFNISAKNCDAILSWKIEPKNKIDSFEVEYSKNDLQFTKVGALPSNNSSSDEAYQYVYDQGNGKGYYRLKLLEKGGKFSYSKTVSVETKCIIKKGF